MDIYGNGNYDGIGKQVGCTSPSGPSEATNAWGGAGTSGNDKLKHYNNIETNFFQETALTSRSHI